MLNVISLAIFAVILFAVSIICKSEVKKNQRNPLPKFENGDKRFKDITMYKTRTIFIGKNKK